MVYSKIRHWRKFAKNVRNVLKFVYISHFFELYNKKFSIIFVINNETKKKEH